MGGLGSGTPKTPKERVYFIFSCRLTEREAARIRALCHPGKTFGQCARRILREDLDKKETSGKNVKNQAMKHNKDYRTF